MVWVSAVATSYHSHTIVVLRLTRVWVNLFLTGKHTQFESCPHLLSINRVSRLHPGNGSFWFLGSTSFISWHSGAPGLLLRMLSGAPSEGYNLTPESIGTLDRGGVPQCCIREGCFGHCWMGDRECWWNEMGETSFFLVAFFCPKLFYIPVCRGFHWRKLAVHIWLSSEIKWLEQ